MANSPAPEAWKSEFNNGRAPVGDSLFGSPDNLSAKPGSTESLRPKHAPEGDVIGVTSGVAHRRGDGQVGATYRIEAVLPAQEHENASVQANGRILPSVAGRNKAFYLQGVYDDTSA